MSSQANCPAQFSIRHKKDPQSPIVSDNDNDDNDKVANGAGHIELLSSKQLGEKFSWLITDGVVAGCYGGNNEVEESKITIDAVLLSE